MSVNWAEENLQTIRTLMERASVYRRALAPVSMAAGGMGLIAAGVAEVTGWTADSHFAFYWLAVAFLTGAAALGLVRRQALQAREEFWSPPARRVARALLPMFMAGLGLGVLEVMTPVASRDSIRLVALWMILYGGALHSAGFFMRRGLKLLGCAYVLGGLGILALKLFMTSVDWTTVDPHWLMTAAFGLGNLFYGIYLKATAEPLETE